MLKIKPPHGPAEENEVRRNSRETSAKSGEGTCVSGPGTGTVQAPTLAGRQPSSMQQKPSRSTQAGLTPGLGSEARRVEWLDTLALVLRTRLHVAGLSA